MMLVLAGVTIGVNVSWLPSFLGCGPKWLVAGAAEPAHTTAAHAVPTNWWVVRRFDSASPLDFLDAKDAGSEDTRAYDSAAGGGGHGP